MNEVTSRKNCKHVILITSDNKDDWWWKHSGKILGPRHELVEEICIKANVNLFYMYNAEQFLVHAKEYLNAKVSQESIEQVRDVMQQRLPNRFLTRATKSHQVTERIYNHLREVYASDEVAYQDITFPEIIRITNESGQRIGYETKFFTEARHTTISLRDVFDRAHKAIHQKNIDHLIIYLVCEDGSELQRVRGIVKKRFTSEELNDVIIAYGLATFEDEENLVKLEIEEPFIY